MGDNADLTSPTHPSLLPDDADLSKRVVQHGNSALIYAVTFIFTCVFSIFLTLGGYPSAVNSRTTFQFVRRQVSVDSISIFCRLM